MVNKRILFISGSFGLGHVTRDLAIAKELRKRNPRIEISWIASEPASSFLANAKEKMHPASKEWANENITAENAARGNQLNLIRYLLMARDQWAHNADVFKRIMHEESFDLAIGDETYEIITALKRQPEIKKMPFVMIYDFIGSYAMTKSPIENFVAYYWNRFWSKDPHKESHVDMRLFVGELEDIPDTKFGFLLPRRRDWAEKKCKFLGYVLQFDPGKYRDKKKIRAELGYGKEPLIVSSIGGTAIGKELLNLCAQSYTIVKEKIPSLRMVLVCGPNIATEGLKVAQGINVKGYVPKLYEHFAASDLSIVQAGGTTTIELTALKTPFLYFPIIEHSEQRICVSYRLARHKAGVHMEYSETTPESLADAILQNIGKNVDYADIPTNGAQKAAELVSRLL